MGKNKKSQIIFEGIQLDSNEELQFIHWLNECKQYGLISKYEYQPEEYNLSDKVTFITKVIKGKKVINKENTLLNSHIYTPDFSVMFTKLFYELCQQNNWIKIFKNIEIDKPLFIDVKGSFNQGGGDRIFSINQKWVYQKYKIFIHKIVPADLFKLTWCPELCKLTPKKKQIVEKYKDFKTITQILKG